MLTSLMLIGAAHAQVAGGTVTGGDVPELNAQAFRPSIDSRPYFWITDTALLKEGAPSFRGTLSYTKDPLVHYPADENTATTTLVGGVTQLDLAAGYVTGPARLGVLVPVYLRAGGLSTTDDSGTDVSITGLGDLMADLKIQLLNRDEDAIGFALSGRTSLPTATTDLALATSGLLYEVEGGLDHGGRNRVMAAAGTQGRNGTFVVAAGVAEGVLGLFVTQQLGFGEIGHEATLRIGDTLFSSTAEAIRPEMKPAVIGVPS